MQVHQPQFQKVNNLKGKFYGDYKTMKYGRVLTPANILVDI